MPKYTTRKQTMDAAYKDWHLFQYGPEELKSDKSFFIEYFKKFPIISSRYFILRFADPKIRDDEDVITASGSLEFASKRLRQDKELQELYDSLKDEHVVHCI